MFGRVKTGKLTAAALAALIAVIAVTVTGSSFPPVTVKLTPAMVEIDTTSLPPKVAQSEMQAVWRLFDRDTETAYMPTETSQITVSLPGSRIVSGIRVYGASSYKLNLYRDVNGTWEPVSSLTGLNLTSLDPSWNSFTVSKPFTTSQLLFELVPQGNVTAGLGEIEILGPETISGDKSASYLTLEGVSTPKDMLGILAKSPSHIKEYSASPSELSVPGGATPSVSIGLTQAPALFKRAYILYDGYRLVRSVSIQRRINGLSWSGGFDLPQSDDALPSWSSYLEEINPAWLVQGDNKIEFRTTGSPATIRGLKLIVETDSGWNIVSSVTATALYDGDTSTSYAIAASPTKPYVQINFERMVQPETLRLSVPGPMSVTAGVQYQSGGAWQDVKKGWQIDLSTLQAGWNDITIPAAVSAQSLRLVFNTDGLTIKPGVKIGEVNELRVSASPVGAESTAPRIVISYPRDGEYFGRTAYLQGFATPTLDSSGNAGWVSIEGKDAQRSVPDGSFSISLAKDETHFYDQADDDAWQPVAQSLYDGQIGVMQSVLLNKNAGALTDTSPDSESRNNAPFTDKREHHTETVTPGQAKKIQYNGVTLDIPQGAVERNTDITIVPLTEADLAHYDPGMINVTYPAAGYRFLPHGIKFKKAINISFGYSKQLFVAGQTDNDVNMFYYDETLLQWQQLTRVKVDPTTSQVTSSSDHFTDIINSTLVVPEHPQALSFNPNSIKDIKAADPSASVNLIEPPKANNKGTANLSYPIEVPSGRNRLQPNISLQYNSSGGNGWMGLGWDIPMQSISIDTRWGAARYNPTMESDTYTFDGEQLSPVAHRGPLVARVSERVFHTRVEGQFRKVIRHGSSPKNYWWEVIDKNGTRYFYGGDSTSQAPVADSTLTDDNGNVFLWSLREIRDRNNNFVRYHCVRVQDPGVPGGLMGVNLYLQKITYTGSGTAEGPYSVAFTRDRDLGETLRTDKQSDARGGFKRETADLLRRVDVSLGSQLIRSYEFKYNENPYGDNQPGTAFYKTLLTSISQYGAKGTLFNKHDFTYYDEARNSSGNYLGFAASTSWNVGSDNISAGLMGYGAASALGGNTGSGGGGHIYIGVGTADKDVTDKTNTAGLKVGYNQSDSEALLTMADMDGDGLPDKVFKGSDGFYYRKNLSGPRGNAVFGPPVKLVTLPAISHENVTTTTIGAESYFVIPAMFDHNMGETESDTYFTDVNGDGLTDVVSGGQVWFNHLENGVPTFTLNSADTPVSINTGTIDTNGLLADPSAKEAERAAKFPLLDTIRRWVAPYDGTVTIDAPVRLMQDTSTARAHYTKADGVRVAIQLEGGELWSSTIAADDYGSHVPTGVSSVQVHRGDRLYFRVQSVYNGLYDQVAWDPAITYLNVDTTRTDVNSLTEYRYQASQDFTLAGRHTTVTAPLTGTLHLAGTWQKTGVTTDDVTLTITRNGTEVYRRTLGFSDTAMVSLSQDLAVTKLDVLEWSILVDSPIDATQVKLTPSAYYTAAEGVDRVTDDHGNYIITVNPPYGMDLYPVNTLTAPQQFLITTQTGTLTVQASLDLNPTITVPTQVAFTAKRRSALLGKGVINITRDAGGNLVFSPVTLTFPMNQGDQIFFDFSTRDVNLADQVRSSSVQVTYDTTAPINYINAPSAFHSAETENAFPVRYRGWGAVGYNGNSPRDGQPINQSLLVIDSSYDPNNAYVYPYAPLPAEELWGEVDDSAWVKAGAASSSRLGLKDISMPHSDQFAGASAPSRISESTNDALSVGVGGSSGSSQSKLEFQDLNGDGFPDVIGNSGVQYTRATGELNPTTSSGAGLGSARSSNNESFNASTDGAGNIARAIANARGNDAPKGQQPAPTSSQGSDMSRLGFGADAGYGTSDTDYDLIDVNGDGLPDKVHRDGTVQLNLGYSFSPIAEPWGGGIINNGQTLNGGVNMGFNLNHYSIAGGLNLGIDTTRSDETYIDINGDGLPDKVTVNGDGSLSVRFNTGAGFTDPITWLGGFGKVAVDKHISLGGGVFITFGFKIPVPPIRIVINPGIGFSTSMGRPEVAFRDMDGDGYVDQVSSTNDGQLLVAQNQIGRTNLLKSVKRSLGGSISLEYQREGNTYDMPQSQWTMTKSTLTDGRRNSYVSTFSYDGGYKDRYEREFYGFRTVTETHAPGTTIQRSITETFNNSDFYLKGLLEKSVTSGNGHVWARIVNTYTLTPVQGFDFTEFPALTQTDTYFYDGNDRSSVSEDGFKKSTYQTFNYDSYGNVTSFFDAGEVFTAADDVTATITYYTDLANYIIKPQEIKVYGTANNSPLRWRNSDYDPATGNMIKLTLNNTGAQNSVWKMAYDGYGNVQTITDPVGYVLTYIYDPTTFTYVTKIQDNFSGASGGPYYSTASYNLLFGEMATSVDLNKNVEARGYDEFGRLTCVFGPYDAAPADPDTCTGSPTIAFAYTPPVLSADNETLTAPAHAVTYNRAVSVKGSSPIIIKTITYVDGMKRILQTKKDADKNGAYGMTVSGQIVFDDLGRVTQQGQPVFESGYNEAFGNQPAKNPTFFAYDTLDRTVMIQTPDGNAPGSLATTTTTYTFGQVSNSGNLYAMTIVVDPEGNKVNGANRRGTKVSFKDVDDRIVAVTEYNNGVPITTTYAYDPLGQIATVADAKNNITTVAYDMLGHRIAITNPDTGKTGYKYDANGNLTEKSMANNNNVRYAYAFNRLTDITYPQSPTVHYDYGFMNEAYNRAGRIKQVTDESGTEWRYYGKLGETTREEKMVNAHTPSQQNKKYTTDYIFDSFGRMVDMTYPDGEALHYAYDNGGLLKAAWGEKEGNRYNYINSLLYDEFGQRTHIEYGNNTKTNYTYDDKTRRLETLVTTLNAVQGSRQIQNLSYHYDLVGNVLNLENGIQVATNTALPAGPVSQSFGYDDLYQITAAKGTYGFGPGKQNNYTSAFSYDTIGNMTRKEQVNQIIQPSASVTLPKETNYVLSYAYGNQPHAVIDAGDKLYSYDASGNMTGWKSKTSGQKRTIIWNEENRVKEIDDSGKATYFLYDDAGERVVKRGQYGETVYINRFYSVKNGELGTKHIFAGETRVLSKLVKTPNTTTANSTTTTPGSNGLNHGRGKKLGIIKRLPDGTTTGIVPPIEKDEFYYHGDHLGSSNMITDSYGAVYQHLEYFPYGESWIEEGGSHGGNLPGYQFTGKELDPETGLYYYGARYYDPVLSKWISADPAFAKYLPTLSDEATGRRLVNAGVYNFVNLAVYSYATNNPVRYIDPNGLWRTPTHGKELTLDVLTRPNVGYSTKAAQEIARANMAVDYGTADTMSIKGEGENATVAYKSSNPVRWFKSFIDDAAHATGGAGGLEAAKARVEKLKGEAIMEAISGTKGSLARARNIMGQASHTLQDEYAHKGIGLFKHVLLDVLDFFSGGLFHLSPDDPKGHPADFAASGKATQELVGSIEAGIREKKAPAEADEIIQKLRSGASE
jgi:RHS repeat-associated protein